MAATSESLSSSSSGCIPRARRPLVAELTFPLDRAAAALRGWRDLAGDAPRQATLTAGISGDTVNLGYVWAGDPEVSLQAYGGAIAEVDQDATAFTHHRTRFDYVASVKWSDPGEDILRMGAARRAATKLDPSSTSTTT
jgi:hypothetical protein